MATSPRTFFLGFGQLLKEKSDLAQDASAVVEFKLDDGSYVMDFKNRRTRFKSGSDIDCTFILSTADFMKMILGEEDSMELFMSQKLKIEGDMGVAMELGGHLEAVTPEEVLAAAKRVSKL